MENVTVSSGTFRSVFDYCTGDTADMAELYFDGLFERHNKLYFCTPDEAGRVHVPLPQYPGRAQDTTLLQRVGDEVKQPIAHRYHHDILPDSPQVRDLREQRRREYGPVRNFYYY